MIVSAPLSSDYWASHSYCHLTKFGENESTFCPLYKLKFQQAVFNVSKAKHIVAVLERMKSFTFRFAQSSYFYHLIPFVFRNEDTKAVNTSNGCFLNSRVE